MAPLLLLVLILLLSSAVLVYPFSSCQLSCSSNRKGYHHYHNLYTSHVKNIITSSYHTDHQYGCSIPRDSSSFPLFVADDSEEPSDFDILIEDIDSTNNIIETKTKRKMLMLHCHHHQGTYHRDTN